MKDTEDRQLAEDVISVKVIWTEMAGGESLELCVFFRIRWQIE